MMQESERYSRNIALFGQQGQRMIAECAIGVVGLGGLGSHVAQQTAFLGVQRFILADHDLVTLSSLNRLVGATEDDVDKTPKVKVAERVVLSIQPTALVTSLTAAIGDEAVKTALLSADLIFGCVDNDAARLVLTELAASHRKPYIDAASDTGDDGGLWYGGRVVFAHDGSKCLSCAGELDQRAITRAGMTPEQRAEDDKIYGVSRSVLNGTGPAVVSINGVVASLAVTEFMTWATGIRMPYSHLSYRGDLGRVTLNKDVSASRCYYCSKYRS
jgi:molybdopterin-synthase adenylyltransferase